MYIYNNLRMCKEKISLFLKKNYTSEVKTFNNNNLTQLNTLKKLHKKLHEYYFNN